MITNVVRNSSKVRKLLFLTADVSKTKTAQYINHQKSYTSYLTANLDQIAQPQTSHTLPAATAPPSAGAAGSVSSLTEWRSRSARLYLRAPALRPLICTEEQLETRGCLDCASADSTGIYPAWYQTGPLI